MLLQSYYRRKRFEARILAAELARLIGGGRAGGGNGRVSPDEMLSMMGVTF